MERESSSERLRSARPPEPSESESDEALFVRDFSDPGRARKRLLDAAEREASWLSELVESWSGPARLAG